MPVREGLLSSSSEDEDVLLDNIEEIGSLTSDTEKSLFRKLGISFFLFGLINNVLYVIILSAALDLVPPTTPKGIIAFCNIAPSLVAKIGWPYLLKGAIRYQRRIVGCCFLSVLGMLVVAAFDSLYMRLLGIGLASFSCGLGELTFLQLSTTYSPPSVGAHSVGYFSSGTGAAGLVGAFLWWEVRNLGVRTGVGLSSLLPFVTPVVYLFLLPSQSAFMSPASPTAAYTRLPTGGDEREEESGASVSDYKASVALSLSDKWRLAQPLIGRYMIPLFCVYLFEYTINQGVSPTLLYPVPDPEDHPVIGFFISSLRDYYPLWQLVYQSTVFLSRSAITLGLPPLPKKLLPVPAIVQAIVLTTLIFESAVGIFGDAYPVSSIVFVFFLISIEGVCGGSAYVNTYHHLNQEKPSAEGVHDLERAKQEREFKMGSVGLSDSFGILFASLLAMPTELALCEAQVGRGKKLCRTL